MEVLKIGIDSANIVKISSFYEDVCGENKYEKLVQPQINGNEELLNKSFTGVNK